MLDDAIRQRLLKYQREGESWAAFAGRAQVSEKTLKAWLEDDARTPNPAKLAFALKNLAESEHREAAENEARARGHFPRAARSDTTPPSHTKDAGAVNAGGEGLDVADMTDLERAHILAVRAVRQRQAKKSVAISSLKMLLNEPFRGRGEPKSRRPLQRGG